MDNSSYDVFICLPLCDFKSVVFHVNPAYTEEKNILVNLLNNNIDTLNANREIPLKVDLEYISLADIIYVTNYPLDDVHLRDLIENRHSFVSGEFADYVYRQGYEYFFRSEKKKNEFINMFKQRYGNYFDKVLGEITNKLYFNDHH